MPASECPLFLFLSTQVLSQMFRAGELQSEGPTTQAVPTDRPTGSAPWILRYTSEDADGTLATPKARVVNVVCAEVGGQAL